MHLIAKFSLLAFAAFLTACSSSQKIPDSSSGQVAFFAAEEAPQQTGRKILYSAYLTLVVENPDTANLRIEQIAERYEGYASEIGTYQSVIRVKSGQLEAAIADISTLGRLDRKNLRGDDVTEEYFDYQVRLENAQKARGRYLELLDQAQTVDEILKVEKELERLNETIDLLKGKMNRIDHLSAFATITINLQERKKPGVLGYIGLGLYHSVKWLFVRG